MRQQSQGGAWRALKATLGLGAAAAASLALASAASAAVIVITPDSNTGSDHLTAAINQANTNGSTSNTIVLSPGTYQPANEPITISKNLNIVVDHSLQAPAAFSAASVEVQGARATLASDNNLFNIPHGVSVRMDGWDCDGCGGVNFAAVFVNGSLTWNGMSSLGDQGEALNVSSIGNATLNDSAIEGDLQQSISLGAGTLTLNNVSIDQGSFDGIDITQAGYTLNMTNVLMAFQGGIECNGGVATNGGPGSLDDDGSCGVQYSDDTNVDSYYPLPQLTEGGPTAASYLPVGNPDTTGRGVNCPTTDQRFFLNPVVAGKITCDIGGVTNGATQETTAPTCQVTSTNEGTTPATQQVSVQDLLSGIGPQPGLATDNPTNTVATAYPPPAAVPVPGYAVSNLQINNGTVAFTPFTSVSTNPLVLTASKTTAGVATQWSFTGLNWAGVSRNCF